MTNTDVTFRDAEIAIIHNLDYRIRCHRSRGDSGQGEAERTNSAIGDALVDGATINWEHTKRFEGMSEDEIQSMSLKEYECYEEMRMQSNAWYVSKIIQERIQDAPVLNEYISHLYRIKQMKCSSQTKICCMSLHRKVVSRQRRKFLVLTILRRY